MKLKIQASYFIIFLALLALFFGCSAKSPEAKTTATTDTASPVNDSIPFPVYMTFHEFEPLLNQSNDTTYVINFWATWCKPCVEELPLFYEKLIPAVANPTGASKPVKVLLVSMDFPKDIQKKLIPFVAERKLEKHVVALADLDYNSWIDKVSTEWDGAIPFTVVYHQKSRKIKSGEMANYEELSALVEEVRQQ